MTFPSDEQFNGGKFHSRLLPQWLSPLWAVISKARNSSHTGRNHILMNIIWLVYHTAAFVVSFTPKQGPNTSTSVSNNAVVNLGRSDFWPLSHIHIRRQARCVIIETGHASPREPNDQRYPKKRITKTPRRTTTTSYLLQ